MQQILPEYNNMGLISQSIKALKKREVMQGRFAVWRKPSSNSERQDDDMNITKEQVQHAASLSKLKLDDAQQQRMIEDLADIIAFADWDINPMLLYSGSIRCIPQAPQKERR